MAKHFKEYSGFSKMQTNENTLCIAYNKEKDEFEKVPIIDQGIRSVYAPCLQLDIPALFFAGIETVTVAEKDNFVMVLNDMEFDSVNIKFEGRGGLDAC